MLLCSADWWQKRQDVCSENVLNDVLSSFYLSNGLTLFQNVKLTIV